MMYICIARIGMGLINLVAQNKVLLTSLKVKAYKFLVFFKRSKNYSRGQVRETFKIRLWFPSKRLPHVIEKNAEKKRHIDEALLSAVHIISVLDAQGCI